MILLVKWVKLILLENNWRFVKDQDPVKCKFNEKEEFNNQEQANVLRQESLKKQCYQKELLKI